MSLSDFYVNTKNETIHVKTIDYYTYMCGKCDQVDNCEHTRAVRRYVDEEMRKYFEKSEFNKKPEHPEQPERSGKK